MISLTLCCSKSRGFSDEEIDISVSQSEIHVTIQKMEVDVDKSLSNEPCIVLSDPPFKSK